MTFDIDAFDKDFEEERFMGGNALIVKSAIINSALRLKNDRHTTLLGIIYWYSTASKKGGWCEMNQKVMGSMCSIHGDSVTTIKNDVEFLSENGYIEVAKSGFKNKNKYRISDRHVSSIFLAYETVHKKYIRGKEGTLKDYRAMEGDLYGRIRKIIERANNSDHTNKSSETNNSKFKNLDVSKDSNTTDQKVKPLTFIASEDYDSLYTMHLEMCESDTAIDREDEEKDFEYLYNMDRDQREYEWALDRQEGMANEDCWGPDICKKTETAKPDQPNGNDNEPPFTTKEPKARVRDADGEDKGDKSRRLRKFLKIEDYGELFNKAMGATCSASKRSNITPDNLPFNQCHSPFWGNEQVDEVLRKWVAYNHYVHDFHYFHEPYLETFYKKLKKNSGGIPEVAIQIIEETITGGHKYVNKPKKSVLFSL